MGRPYREIRISESSILREFRCDVPNEELEWHMDRRDRVVTVIKGDDWKLQLESGLPFDLIEGRSYTIPRESWHRVHRGSSDLRIFIDEFDSPRIIKT